MVRKKKDLLHDIREPVSLNPEKLVNYFYNKVKLKTAAMVIFYAVLLETILLAVLGVPKILQVFIFNLLDAYIIYWVLVGAIIYLILYLVKGNLKVKSYDFNKILSGLASFKIIQVIAMLLIVIITMIFLPELIPFINNIISNPTIAYSATVLPVIGGWGNIGIFLLILLSIFLIVYYLKIIYEFIRNVFKYKQFGVNLLLMLIILIIMGLLGSLL
jgi:hypothetical protein